MAEASRAPWNLSRQQGEADRINPADHPAPDEKARAIGGAVGDEGRQRERAGEAEQSEKDQQRRLLRPVGDHAERNGKDHIAQGDQRELEGRPGGGKAGAQAENRQQAVEPGLEGAVKQAGGERERRGGDNRAPVRPARPLDPHRRLGARRNDGNGGGGDQRRRDQERQKPFGAGDAEQGRPQREAGRQNRCVKPKDRAALRRRRGGADPEFANHKNNCERQAEKRPQPQPDPIIGAKAEAEQRRDRKGDRQEKQRPDAEEPRQNWRQRRAEQSREPAHRDMQAIGMGGKAGGLQPQPEQRNDQRQPDSDD